MKTKLALLLALFIVAFATPAMAQKIQALNIFPWTPGEVDAPLYSEDLGSMCLTDIVGTLCEVNQDAGTWKDINYSGSVDYVGSVPFSGSAYYDGSFPVEASGTVQYPTFNKIAGGGQFSYAVIGADECAGDADKDNCCQITGEPDAEGRVHMVCFRVPAANIIKNETFVYDICEDTVAEVPWTFNGTGHYVGYVPYSGTADYSGSVPYSGTIQNAYKEYGPADVILAEGNVILTCPDQSQVPTQTISFKELVTNAHVGDTLAGDVQVVSGGTLSSFLWMDSDNYQKYTANEPYTALFKQENFSQMSMRQGVTSADRFYIVFANAGNSTVECWARFVLE